MPCLMQASKPMLQLISDVCTGLRILYDALLKVLILRRTNSNNQILLCSKDRRIDVLEGGSAAGVSLPSA